MDNTATNPDGRTCISGAGTTGSLLLPGLFTGEIYSGLRLDGGGTTAPIGSHGDNYVMDSLSPFTVSNDVDVGFFGLLGSENSGAHELIGGFCG
jgi:hypothetical protein